MSIEIILNKFFFRSTLRIRESLDWQVIINSIMTSTILFAQGISSLLLGFFLVVHSSLVSRALMNGSGNNQDLNGSYLKGVQLSNLGDQAGAALHFRQAVHLNPSFQQAWKDLGNSLFAIGEYSGSIDAYQRAYQLSPEDTEINYNWALALLKANRSSEAMDHFQQVLSINPSHVDALLNVAHIHHESGNLRDASELYTKVFKQDRKHAEARYNLCNILHAFEQLIAAEICYHDVLRLDPSYTESIPTEVLLSRPAVHKDKDPTSTLFPPQGNSAVASPVSSASESESMVHLRGSRRVQLKGHDALNSFALSRADEDSRSGGLEVSSKIKNVLEKVSGM